MPKNPFPNRVRLWIHTHLVPPLKKAHWLFGLGDFVRYRLALQDEQVKAHQQQNEHMKKWVEQQVTLATIMKRVDAQIEEVATRLVFHERGPLLKSAALLHRRRVEQAQREAAKKNGGRVADEVRSQPTKRIDASGQVVDIAPADDAGPMPPPGEAVTELDDESEM